MAIVINGSGTVTGLAVGGLPDGTVDTDTLANTTVTAAKVAADVATQSELDTVSTVASAAFPAAGGTIGGNSQVSGSLAVGAALISQSELSVTQTNGGHWVSKMVHTSTDAPMLLLQNAMNSGSFGNSHIEFLINNGTTVGTIKCSNSATQYNTSSDYRLKENVDYTWDATTRLKQLKPARFNFIVDNTKTVDGFIAHEVSSVVPEAISGEKDAVDDDGNAVHQGIDQSKLVPLLVKTIQELEARITALEA